jgi:hypothetical protein
MLDQTFSTQDGIVLVLWGLTVTAGVVLVSILLQVLGLLKEVRRFLEDAQRELKPMMTDLPAITSHVESISAQAEKGATAVGDGLASLKTIPNKAKVGAQALVSGLSRAFQSD